MVQEDLFGQLYWLFKEEKEEKKEEVIIITQNESLF